jgi:hypothetical protein
VPEVAVLEECPHDGVFADRRTGTVLTSRTQGSRGQHASASSRVGRMVLHIGDAGQ